MENKGIEKLRREDWAQQIVVTILSSDIVTMSMSQQVYVTTNSCDNVTNSYHNK